MTDAMLTCPEIVELVTDYLEDRISPQLRRRFDVHLAQCEGCTAYLDQMRQLLRLAGTLHASDTAVDPPLLDRLLDAYRAAQDDVNRDPN